MMKLRRQPADDDAVSPVGQLVQHRRGELHQEAGHEGLDPTEVGREPDDADRLRRPGPRVAQANRLTAMRPGHRSDQDRLLDDVRRVDLEAELVGRLAPAGRAPAQIIASSTA